jgi:hypothetical protein
MGLITASVESGRRAQTRTPFTSIFAMPVSQEIEETVTVSSMCKVITPQGHFFRLKLVA